MTDEVQTTREDREAALAGVAPSWRNRPDAEAWIVKGGAPHSSDRTLYAAHCAARAIARTRIAAERAGYERGVREASARCAKRLLVESTRVRTNRSAWRAYEHGEDFADDVADLLGDIANEMDEP